jgi:hypothetical protein
MYALVGIGIFDVNNTTNEKKDGRNALHSTEWRVINVEVGMTGINTVVKMIKMSG